MNRGDTTQLTETTWQLCSRHAPSALMNNYAVRLLAVTSRLRVAYIVSSSFVGFCCWPLPNWPVSETIYIVFICLYFGLISLTTVIV